MNCLHELSARLLATTELQPLLKDVWANNHRSSNAPQSADFGNAQIYHPKTKSLRIVARRHRGAIEPLVSDIVMPGERSVLESAETLTASRLEMRLCQSTALSVSVGRESGSSWRTLSARRS